MTTNQTTDLRAERMAASVNRKVMADALGWSQFRLDRFELGDREATDADVKAWKATLKKLTTVKKSTAKKSTAKKPTPTTKKPTAAQ